jgi:DNA adenine methylase
MIGRVGGKSKIKNVIIDKMPEHQIYVEPFIGGGSVFFSKEPVKVNIINDLDTDIYNIYKDMKDIGDKMINKDFTPTRYKFNKLKNQKKFKNNIDRLYRNLYLSLNSFSSNRKGYVGEKEEIYKKNSEVGKKYKTTKWKDFLNENNVKIYNKDFCYLINKYDSNNTLFYLDPPYSKSTTDYAVGGIEPQKIFECLENIKGKFILSYDKSKDIKNIFKKYKFTTITTIYEVSGTRQEGIEEYLITNF